MLGACLKHGFRSLGAEHGGSVGLLANRGTGTDVDFVLNKIGSTQTSGRLRQDISISVSNSDRACFSGWDNTDWLRSKGSAVGLWWDTLGGYGSIGGGKALLHIGLIIA